MASSRQKIGAEAEARAALHLIAAGLTILHRNYRCRMGELDLVAREGPVLVVAEVRLRADDRFGGAAASITPAKQRRIVLATRYLLMRFPVLQKCPIRFDALLVPPTRGSTDEQDPITWIRGAFAAH